MPMNETKLQEFLGTMVNELGAAANSVLVMMGDKLGLYKAIAQAGPLTSAQLAQRTGTAERYVREWLAAQAASGYIEYDPQTAHFSMTPEQAAVLADEESPAFIVGGFYSLASLFIDEPKMTEAFRTGKGFAWGEHHPCLFCGVERAFRPNYRANLTASWLPALDGVVERFSRGSTAADVGCGHGVSTILMAEAFPNSQFIGFDFHPLSIEHARQLAREAGVDNVAFEVATAKTYPRDEYDLIAFFDCLHDMGDPVGAAAHARQSLDSDGVCMIVEPFAGDTLEQNLNPVGRVCYAFSTTICTPSSLSQEVGLGLGAQAGEARIRNVVTQGGFTRFRRAAETPFNLIFEARP